jgi:hypothetical protein
VFPQPWWSVLTAVGARARRVGSSSGVGGELDFFGADDRQQCTVAREKVSMCPWRGRMVVEEGGHVPILHPPWSSAHRQGPHGYS